MQRVDWVLINNKKESLKSKNKEKSIACLLAYFEGSKIYKRPNTINN